MALNKHIVEGDDDNSAKVNVPTYMYNVPHGFPPANDELIFVATAEAEIFSWWRNFFRKQHKN